MARIPSLEDLLLEMNQGLGLTRPQTKDINRFRGLSLPFPRYQAMSEQLVDGIASALELDETARRDAFLNLAEWMNFNKLIELHTWTGAASDRQVLWHMLAYVYVPGFARRLALWSFDGVQADRRIDAGMPGGDFWFLPSWEDQTGECRMPVRKVTDWLLDLLGDQTLEAGIGALRSEKDVVRRIEAWRLEGRIPKSNQAIEDLFPDGASLNFQGAFDLDDQSDLSATFRTALEFVHRRRLTATGLANQIPMSETRIQNLLDGSDKPVEQEAFVRNLLVRYSKPAMATIRQRFRVARLAQDGYQRLVKFLFPDIAPACSDARENKVVQLIALFQNVHNLTIESCMNGDAETSHDEWFESKLSPLDKGDLLLSIVPSIPGEFRFRLVAERISHRLGEQEPSSPIADLVALPALMQDVVRQRLASLQAQRDEEKASEAVLDRLRRESPWRAIQAVDSIPVIRRVLACDGLSARIRLIALDRMGDLARADRQRIEALVAKTNWLMADRPLDSTTDLKSRVETYLCEAETLLKGASEWRPQVLNLKARHRLMQERFQESLAEFAEAFTESLNWGIGQFAGELARDTFSVDLVVHGFRPAEQERYYRQMIAFGIFENVVPPIEDAAVACEEYFWSELYRPYGESGRRRIARNDDIREVAKTGWLLAVEGRTEEFGRWIEKSGATLRKQDKAHLRQNSVLLHWLKVSTTYENMCRTNQDVLQFRANFEAAVRTLIEAYPDQARMTDFKKQTPLILAADQGYVRLIEILLPHSAIDAQDYLGRTALHAAVTRRSAPCLNLLLACDPDVERVTKEEGHSILHTAVRVACVECVRAIVDQFPGLLFLKNTDGHRPVSLARKFLTELGELNALLKLNKRSEVSHSDLREVADLLASQEDLVR